MRVAVMSDIHGYSIALDAILADIDHRGPFDRIVVAGDLCESGPDPAGVLDRLLDREIVLLKGNTDDDLANGVRDSATAQWTIAQLSPERLALLGDLPLELRISPVAHRPDLDLLVVHANPHDLFQKFEPSMTDRECRELIGEVRFGMLAFGHVHIAFERRIDDTRLVDVSAVGNPKDGDLRPRWSEFTCSGPENEWHHARHYLDYPLAETDAQIQRSGIPKPDRVYRRLVHASYRPID